MPHPTAETARALLWRHGLPEDVIDGVLCLHAQELAAAQRAHANDTDGEPGCWHDGAHVVADLIDPTCDAQPAASAAVSSPPPDQTTVERIAAALYEAEYPGFDWTQAHDEDRQRALDRAAAVLAVLPPHADRAAVLLEAADELGRMDYDEDSRDYGYDTYRDAWNGGAMDGADLLRRAAAETPQPEGQATLSGRIARLVAEDASALRMDLYEDLATYARETGNTGLQHAQIRDHLTEFLFEGLLRRLAAEAQQPEPGPLDRVRALHVPTGEGNCRNCGYSYDPCPTIAALDGQQAGTEFGPGEGVYGQDPYYDGAEAQQPDIGDGDEQADGPTWSDTCPHCERWYTTSEPGAHEAACPMRPVAETQQQPDTETPTVTRAAAWRQAANVLAALDPVEAALAGQHAWTDAAALLRRMADEAQQAERPGTEAQPPRHRWSVETRDGVADQWAPGTRFLNRHHAVERYEALNENHPLWKDGTPVERRIVRETTTYTVEAPAVPVQPAAADRDRTVAYRSDGGRQLHCLRHVPPPAARHADFHPVTSEDLPDGGICTFPDCGVDVLIPQKPAAADTREETGA